jgi:hypothetical protein
MSYKMISNFLTPLCLIKLAAFIVLTYMFVNMFSDDLQKFRNKITTTGTNIRPHPSKEKKLPCITVCAMSGFRNRGFYYLNQDYIENTYDIGDFFINQTLLEIKNSSKYSLTEVRSMFLGRCYKICDVEEFGSFTIWEFKTELNYKLFFHNDGDEYWLINAITYLIDLAQTSLEVNRTDGISGGLNLIIFFLISKPDRNHFSLEQY